MIVSQTKYSKEIFNDFASYSTKNTIWMRIIYACSGIILACSIVMFVLGETVDAVIDLILGVFFACYGLLVKGLVKLQNRKNIGATDIYIFDDEDLTVEAHDAKGNIIAKTTILYNRLKCTKKYKNYAYVYINTAVVYILVKENFESETQFNFVVDRIQSQIDEHNKKMTEAVALGSQNVTPPAEEPAHDLGEPTPPPDETLSRTDVEDEKIMEDVLKHESSLADEENKAQKASRTKPYTKRKKPLSKTSKKTKSTQKE